MPPAAIPIAGAIAGAAGSAASGAGGKKAQKQANALAQQQLDLQKQQFGLAQGQLTSGNQALSPSTNYWNALLRGGQAARLATAPYATQLGQQAEGTRRAILAETPQGGEQNLAVAQNRLNLGNNLAQLYMGLQPMAAQGLSQNAGLLLGSAGAFNPGANTGGAFGNYGLQQQLAGNAGAGYGNLLFQSLNKLRNGGGGGGYQTVGSGSIPLFGGGQTLGTG